MTFKLRILTANCGVTLVNLQRQLAMMRCYAKNRSGITPRCGRFFRDICSAATRCKVLKAIQKLAAIRTKNMRIGVAIGVAN